MQIIVIGQPVLFDEFREKAGDSHTITRLDTSSDYQGEDHFDMAVDFTADESAENVAELFHFIKADFYLINAVKSSLHEIAYLLDGLPRNVIGFNGLPGFVNRETWEVTALDRDILQGFPFSYIPVDDRVGMVTPRVIAMIINEAYFTVQEGTASREDINKGMKLGTGYPYGPFEWTERIGINHIYELLEALYTETQDERYKICPLLRKEYLLSGQ